MINNNIKDELIINNSEWDILKNNISNNSNNLEFKFKNNKLHETNKKINSIIIQTNNVMNSYEDKKYIWSKKTTFIWNNTKIYNSKNKLLNEKYMLYKNKILGIGQFGKVYFGQNVWNSLNIAIKISLHFNEQNINITTLEYNCMIKFNHNNIVKIYDFFQIKHKYYIIMEYCNGGTLKKFINENKNIDEQTAITYLKQILCGLKQIHENNIVHRDLKPDNIFFHNDILKISDFGLWKILNSNDILLWIVGTPFYMSPQIIMNDIYSKSCDIWAIGVIYYQMLFNKHPYNIKWVADYKQKINLNSLQIDYHNIKISDKSKILINNCLIYDENKRFNIDEIINFITSNFNN